MDFVAPTFHDEEVAVELVLYPKQSQFVYVVHVGAVNVKFPVRLVAPLYIVVFTAALVVFALPPFLSNVTVTPTVFFHVAIIFVFPLTAIFPLAAVPLVVVVVVSVAVPGFTHPLNVQLVNVYGFDGNVTSQLVGIVAPLYTAAILQLLAAGVPDALLTFFFVVTVYCVL